MPQRNQSAAEQGPTDRRTARQVRRLARIVKNPPDTPGALSRKRPGLTRCRTRKAGQVAEHHCNPRGLLAHAQEQFVNRNGNPATTTRQVAPDVTATWSVEAKPPGKESLAKRGITEAAARKDAHCKVQAVDQAPDFVIRRAKGKRDDVPQGLPPISRNQARPVSVMVTTESAMPQPLRVTLQAEGQHLASATINPTSLPRFCDGG